MVFLAQLVNLAFNIYIGIIIVQVAVSWLIAFEVINASSPQAQNLVRLLRKATDPVYSRIRKFIPPIGGFDITPIIVLIGLEILRSIILSILL
jgi:YggT family protein